jgi:hypothetical protein
VNLNILVFEKNQIKMDFRAKGISNKTYATLNEQIYREKQWRLKWNIKYDDKSNSSSSTMSNFSKIDNLNEIINWRTRLNELEYERYIDRNRYVLIRLFKKKIMFF